MKRSYYIKALLIVAALTFIGLIYDSSKDKTGSYYYMAMDYDRQMSMKRIPKNEGNIKKVRYYLDKAREGAPQNVNILYAYANFLYKYNLIDEAKDYYRMAFKLEKDRKKLYQILFATLKDNDVTKLSDEEIQQVIDTSEIALNIYPSDVRIREGLTMIHNNIAWTYATAEESYYRDPQKALRHAKRAVKLSDRKNATFIDTLAEAYYVNQNYQKALDTEIEALKKADTEELKSHIEKSLMRFKHSLNQQKTISKE